MTSSNESPLARAVSAQKAVQQLETLWGRACIGLALLSAYHGDGSPRSAADIAAMAEVSEDTAHRYLSKLTNIGRVERTKSGRSLLYACPPHLAARTLAILGQDLVPT